MTELSGDRLKRLKTIIDDLQSAKFCAPDEDPLEISAVTTTYRYLVTQLQMLASPILDESKAKFLNSINVEYNDIFSVYDASSKIDIIILDINEAIASATQKKNSPPTAGQLAFHTKSLEQLLKKRGMFEAETELKRCLENFQTDDPTALTAACSMIESVCKTYIHDNNLSMPNKQTIKPLWKVVINNLELDPSAVEDDDIKKILSGFTSVVEGIGALRTHKGSAHGRGRKHYRVLPRHARLAIHASLSLVEYVLEKSEHRSNYQ